jgi:glycosyltransferase involved in cell wall biosynthesis
MIRTANVTLSVSRKAGGLFESVRRLVQSLAATGMEVEVYGMADEFTDRDIAAWEPVTVKSFKPTWPEAFGYAPGFLEELIAYEPDITHTHGIWVYPSIATNRYNRRTKTPYIISAHGMLDRWAIENSRWKKVIAHFLYEGAHLRGAHCLRALCEAEARAIRDLKLPNPIAIIPNGIDLPEPVKPGAAGSIPPWTSCVEPGRKVMLYLGRIHPKKGLVNLLRAWAEIKKSKIEDLKSDKWILAIAGWDQGRHEQELKVLCDELGLAWSDVRERGAKILERRTGSGEQEVVFLGPQFNEGKAACYAQCDGFILPSFSEGVPMTVLEAWVNSKPVLMTPQCNLPEGFSTGAALKIETTVASVTDGLNEFWRMSDAERSALGSRGYDLARQRYAWPRLAQQMKELYEWTLGGGARPDCLTDF